MPVYLKEINAISELERCQSILIIPCRFCPAASMAVSTKGTYINFPQHLFKTEAYERLIETIRTDMEAKGILTDVFRSYLPHQFVVCMWTKRRRKKLLKLASKYEGLLVMGCEAAVQTVQAAVQSTSCVVRQGMKTEGIMSIEPRFQLPCHISLELNEITPLKHEPAVFDAIHCMD